MSEIVKCIEGNVVLHYALPSCRIKLLENLLRKVDLRIEEYERELPLLIDTIAQNITGFIEWLQATFINAVRRPEHIILGINFGSIDTIIIGPFTFYPQMREDLFWDNLYSFKLLFERFNIVNRELILEAKKRKNLPALPFTIVNSNKAVFDPDILQGKEKKIWPVDIRKCKNTFLPLSKLMPELSYKKRANGKIVIYLEDGCFFCSSELVV